MKRDQRPHRRGLPAAAENAGRVESYRRAKALGIDLRQEWVATLDGRTRHSHRQLDGEKVAVGEAFSNGCRFPGDPEAPYAETMNCRCTLVGAVEGFDTDDADRWNRLPEGMTYERWKAGGARSSGAISGALNDKNDPDSVRRDRHAKAYYAEVRNRDKGAEVSAISKNVGVSESIVSAAYDHLFVNTHDISGGNRRFDEDYEIAMSWQRMREGVGIKGHDATLLYHESYESKLMESGMSYDEAHERAQRVYNYAGQVAEYVRKGGS